MPTVLTKEFERFTLEVWTNNVQASQTRLRTTLETRGKETPRTYLKINPALAEKTSGAPASLHEIGEPIFFENKQYEFEFIFTNANFEDREPRAEHRARSVESIFHFNKRTCSLRASIQTGNHVGWFTIELVIPEEVGSVTYSISFEVFPLKMDMATDMQSMNEAIEKEFPLWRYSLVEKTQQNLGNVRVPRPEFLLMWLAQFERLFTDLEVGLKHVLNSPHNRLLSFEKSLRADRLTGKLNSKLEEAVARSISVEDWEKKFAVNKKRLSNDTPENRFIKHVVNAIQSKLQRITVSTIEKADHPRISDSFRNRLMNWQKTMRRFANRPLFREIGEHRGDVTESLVLHQKPGYSKAYKAWQQLKWHLELLSDENLLSTRSVAELYEIWCFLEVRRILLALNFEEVSRKQIPLVKRDLEVHLKDGLSGSFRYKREDGIELILAHEPRFGKSGPKIRTWTTAQKPDIYLEARFPTGDRLVWLFDAKYRIADEDEPFDLVPEDAINQMHRYRDALIFTEQSSTELTYKSRPVFGGYALYPGFYNQHTTKNPYNEEIEEVGIGAFSLLPSSDGSGSHWLTEFLRKELSKGTGPDEFFVKEPPRIAYHGTFVSRFKDLVLIANQLGQNRDPDYVHRFESGSAAFYHTKDLAVSRQEIAQHLITEATYLAVAIENFAGLREIEFVYPIKFVQKVRRSEIRRELSGTDVVSDPNELYWTFELGKALQLKDKLILSRETGFRLRFSGLEALAHATDWSDIEERYSGVYP